MESWLHELLCLDAAEHVPRIPPRLPHPDECDLFYVNRNTLFSYHRASEVKRLLGGQLTLQSAFPMMPVRTFPLPLPLANV